MADTVEEIYSEYYVELQTQPTLNTLNPQNDTVQTLLNDLQSNSKVADHRLFIFDFSVFSWMQKNIFKRHKTELEIIISQNRYATPEWWVEQILKWQYGQLPTFVNNRPAYANDEPTLRIAKRAACVSQGGGYVLLKANALLGNNPIALTGGQITSLREYCEMIKPPGSVINLNSLNPDRLRLTADVKLNPQLFNLDGTLISDGSYPIEEAANRYLANIKYNGQMSLTYLKGEIQKVPGLNDFIINNADVLQGGNTYPVTRLFQTVAGSVREESAAGFTFRDLFTYSFGD